MKVLVLVGGICGVASAALLARIGLEAGLSPAALSAWRLTVAAGALLIFLMVRRDLKVVDGWRLAIAGICLAFHFATWIASLEYISVARSTLLVATSPLWAGLAGLFIPSLRPRRAFWIGLAIALVGTLVVTSQGGAAEHRDPAWLGDGLALIGAICIVPYLLLSQAAQTRIGTLRAVTWIYAFAALALWVWLLPQSPSLPHTGEAWLSILGMAILAQLGGHSSLNWALKHFTAAQVATATLMEPVFAALLAWIFLSERVTGLQAAGGAILLLGVGVGLRSERVPTPLTD